MKYIVIVPDGMADYPIKELENRTPLEAARTPNMDYLAQNGITGLVKTIPDNMAPGSDVGNLSLLGYDPKKYLSGRGALEAANLGINLSKFEIAFRCNLVTILNEKMADYSAGHITTKEASELISALNKHLSNDKIRFLTGKSYRHLLILKANDPNMYLKIKTTAPHDILGKTIKDYLPQGAESKLLLQLMHDSTDILQDHSINTVRSDLKENPANMIWLWGQGTRPNLPSFKDKFGVTGGIISAVDLVNGIGKLIGLENIDVPGITGYYDTNYLGKAQYAIDSLKKNDFVFIHIEATDEASHNGDIKAKIEALENIDRHIVGAILNYFDKYSDSRILLLPDHPTPIALRTHASDPVGFAMYGKDIEPNGSEEFSEKAASEKGILFESGEKLLNYFIKKYI